MFSNLSPLISLLNSRFARIDDQSIVMIAQLSAGTSRIIDDSPPPHEHINKINEKTAESQRPYEEVKDSILTSLKARQKSKATRELLDKLKTEAKIEILEPGVTLDPKKAPTNLEGKPPVP